MLQAANGVGAGNAGGNIRLEVTGGGQNGVDPSGVVIVQPKTGEQIVKDLFVVRNNPGVSAIGFLEVDPEGFKATAAYHRTAETTDAIAVSQNDYDPTGDAVANLSVIRVDNTSGGGLNITGLRGQRLGRRITLFKESWYPPLPFSSSHLSLSRVKQRQS